MTPQESSPQVESLKELINEKFAHLDEKIDKYFRDNDMRNDDTAKRIRDLEDWKLTIKATIQAYTALAAALGVIVSIVIKMIWR